MGKIGEISVDGRPVEIILQNDVSHTTEDGVEVHYSTLGWKFRVGDSERYGNYMLVSDPYISSEGALDKEMLEVIQCNVRVTVSQIADAQKRE